VEGFNTIVDDGLGTVTLNGITESVIFIDLGGDDLIGALGPGAFLFIDSKVITSTAAPAVSNTSGVGAHGPSGTAPGQTAEWGIVSGWQQTGRIFCVSSPPLLCTNTGLTHGATQFPELPSNTYDLGTWAFDAVGDFEATQPFIFQTTNGGVTNSRALSRGAFVGASLPALPLVGFGALALSLAVIGGRALMGRK
jgi:hypothetical protein